MNRRNPVPPARSMKAAADHDFSRGNLRRHRWKVDGHTATGWMTATFEHSYRAMRLTPAEGRQLHTACQMLAHDLQHPLLAAEPVPGWDALMASPYPGLTLTYRPHPKHPGQLVLLTLSDTRYDAAAA